MIYCSACSACSALKICLYVSSYLYFLTMIAKLCFEKVYSIASYSSLFCLITIFIYISAIAVFMILNIII